MPELSGKWRRDDYTKKRAKSLPVVARCMTCQILAQEQAGDDSARDRLVDAEMVRRVTVWLKTKGIVWP